MTSICVINEVAADDGVGFHARCIARILQREPIFGYEPLFARGQVMKICVVDR